MTTFNYNGKPSGRRTSATVYNAREYNARKGDRVEYGERVKSINLNDLDGIEAVVENVKF